MKRLPKQIGGAELFKMYVIIRLGGLFLSTTVIICANYVLLWGKKTQLKT